MNTISYETEYITEDDYFVTVKAIIQDEKSTGPYEFSMKYKNIREHESVIKFLEHLKKTNKEIHPN